jgi:hypothetical protein
MNAQQQSLHCGAKNKHTASATKSAAAAFLDAL